MTANTLIRRALLSEHGQALLAAMPPPESFPGRTEFVREVCSRFGFEDALTQLARTELARPVENAFSKTGIGLLTEFAAARRMAPPTDLGTAFRLVAAMGGYLDRKNEGSPGVEPVWNGQSALAFAAWMVGHSVNAGDDSALLKVIR